MVIVAAVTYRYRDLLLGFAMPAGLTGGFFFWFYATTAGVLVKQIVYGALGGLRRLPVQVGLEMATLCAILVWITLDRNDLSLLLLFRIMGYVHLVTAGAGVIAFFALPSALP